MRRVTRIAMMAAFVAAVIGVSGAPASHGCEDGVIYRWCGNHIKKGKILKFRLNTATKPASLSGVSNSLLEDAAAAATYEWDRYWPGPNLSVTTGRPGTCTGASKAVCYEATTQIADPGFVAGDGKNTIAWASPSLCPYGGGGIATSCITYEATANSNGHKRIAEVDILLSPSTPWRLPICALNGDVGAIVTACLEFVRGQVPPAGESWVDLQSVATHEIGHSLGLDHVGSGGYPSDVTDAPAAMQTMYVKNLRETTYQRSIDIGDTIGLQRAALESLQD